MPVGMHHVVSFCRRRVPTLTFSVCPRPIGSVATAPAGSPIQRPEAHGERLPLEGPHAALNMRCANVLQHAIQTALGRLPVDQRTHRPRRSLLRADRLPPACSNDIPASPASSRAGALLPFPRLEIPIVTPSTTTRRFIDPLRAKKILVTHGCWLLQLVRAPDHFRLVTLPDTEVSPRRSAHIADLPERPARLTPWPLTRTTVACRRRRWGSSAPRTVPRAGFPSASARFRGRISGQWGQSSHGLPWPAGHPSGGTARRILRERESRCPRRFGRPSRRRQENCHRRGHGVGLPFYVAVTSSSYPAVGLGSLIVHPRPTSPAHPRGSRDRRRFPSSPEKPVGAAVDDT